ncbi:MAG: methylenetetrahydrofolate reductase [Streptococcaceae bacterium]|jgi:methylenetetrahydrofolate reductase (NADPH)|nr:methylenetetrahydrofolate reductase [Streptococcaceae bacterium]
MKISEIFYEKNAAGKPVVSFEVFPPKTDSGTQTIYQTVSGLIKQPDFISVTYRGDSGDKTSEIAENIKRQMGTEVLHHLTAAGLTLSELTNILSELTNARIENILALRGDAASLSGDFPLAKDLIKAVKSDGHFNVAGACYPEGHVSSPLDTENLDHLRQKAESGADFFISQLFFDNAQFFRMNEAAKDAGISQPISAGVMPIMSVANVERLIFFGASIPTRLIKIINKYKDSPEDLRQAGLEYAFHQLDDLIAHGVDGVHVYTMNRASVANAVMKRYL